MDRPESEKDIFEPHSETLAALPTDPLERGGGARKKAHVWKHVHAMPNQLQRIPAAWIAKRLLTGWKPEAPAIDKSTRVTAFGSCFAANISQYLDKRGYAVAGKGDAAPRAYVIRMGDLMVNSFVIRQQFEWAWNNKAFSHATVFDKDDTAQEFDEEVRLTTKEIFDNTDVFILTFGLSEVFYDADSGEVFTRRLPKDLFDPDRHLFRVSTVEENRANLEAIYQLIRQHAPHAKIIFTLSPIPLKATFREHSCISADTVSKAVLRVAIDETVRAHQAEGVLHYWPSYEIVKEVLPGGFGEDARHPERGVLDFIMCQFEHIWCNPGDMDLPDLERAWVGALCAARVLPRELSQPLGRGNAKRLRRLLERAPKLDPNVKIDEALRALVLRVADRMEQEAPAETG